MGVERKRWPIDPETAREIRDFIHELHDQIDADIEGVLEAGGDPADLLAENAEVAERLRSFLEVKLGGLATAQAKEAYATLGIGFDATDPRVLDWARNYSNARVVEITEEQRAVLQTITGRGFSDGLQIDEIADMVRNVVGLNSQFANAVYNMADGMREQGWSQEVIDRRTSDYADRLLDVRADNIARTEVLTAEGQGRMAGWEQAAADGLFSWHDATKRWIVADDQKLCPVCEPLDGVEVGLDEQWDTDDGPVDMPPAHPRCRCAAVLVPGGATPDEGDGADPELNFDETDAADAADGIDSLV